MKSYALILGAAASLFGFGALADDDKPTARDRTTYDNPAVAPAPAASDDSFRGEMRRDEAVARNKMNDIREKDRADTDARRPPSWIGIGFEAGGGVGGFLDSKASGVTTAAGLWQVRGIVGTRRHFAGEMAYIGGASTLNTFGVTNNATLVTNGFEGAFRWNVLTGMLQPYVTGGVGYQHYSLGSAQISTSDVSSSGEVMTFPLSLGIAWRPGAFVLDGRVAFHPATNSVLLRDTNMSTWDIGAHAGFEF